MQDPDTYLNGLGITVPSQLDPNTQALIDSTHRSIIGHEIFYFADADEKSRFDTDPSAYCGILTDPVSKARFRPTSSSPKYAYNGREYLFSSDSTQIMFAGMPDMYWLPSHQMIRDSVQQK